MAIKGLALEAERTYESKHDPESGTENASKFTLGTLDSRVYGKLKDKATSFNVDPSQPDEHVETSIAQSEVQFQTCQFGIKGWENVQDENGNELPFKTKKKTLESKTYQVVDPDVLRRLPSAVIAELADEISRDNELSEAEAKN